MDETNKIEESDVVKSETKSEANETKELTQLDLKEDSNIVKSSVNDTDDNKVTFKVPSIKVKLQTRTAVIDQEKIKEIEQPQVKEKPKIQPNGESTKQRNVAKYSKLSPAELLKQSEVPIPYMQPAWGGLCQEKYSFEIIKNGTVLNTIDLTTKPFYVFGRLPSCDVSMEHPSLSRHHAVIQYCNTASETRQKGWYLYDLDSTHGTWLNKNKVPAKKYHRLRVGFVLKFGGSTRLHILQGPVEDQDDESELSITEMKQQRELQKKQAELLRQEKMRELEEKKVQDNTEEGCSWGMDGDAFEIDSNNPFAVETAQNEELYIDDPKKSLRGYFEREGLDLPDYEVEELDRGKYQCKVELPVDNEITGEPIIAEATVTGKKKEAVAACALEACRILDKMGELRKANHESRKRKAKNWEENDYYDSDDDTFLDRTGDIERKRKQRMARFGKEKKQNVQTYESIISKLESVEKEMVEIQQKLDKAKAEAQAVEAEEGLDVLDMFMANIKSGAMDTKTKMALKRRMFDLKKEQINLQKLERVARPANVPEPKSTKPVEVTVKRPTGSLIGKIKLKSSEVKSKTTTTHPSEFEEMDFEVEEDDEDDQQNKAKNTETDIENSSVSDIHSDKKLETSLQTCEVTDTNTNNTEPKHHIKQYKSENTDKTINTESSSVTTNSDIKESRVALSDAISDVPSADSTSTEHIERDKLKDSLSSSGTEKIKVKGPALPPGDEFEQVTENPSSKKRTRVRKKKVKEVKNTGNDTDYGDPNYTAWLPPKGQSGDGRTSLNEKYGY